MIRDTGICWYFGHYDMGHRNMLIFRTLWYGTPEYVDISDTMIWETGICWYFGYYDTGHRNMLIFQTLWYGTPEYIDISDTMIRDTWIYWYIGDYDTGHRQMLIFRTLWYGTPEYIDISDTMIWDTGKCWYFGHLLRIISKPILPQLNFTGLNDVTTKTLFHWESIFFQYVKMETQLKLKNVNMWNKLLTVYITHYIYLEINRQIDFNNSFNNYNRAFGNL